MTPRITTVVPTYRRPQLLRRALRSVLAQTFRDLTVLVCDNASGDETAQVVAEFAAEDPRVVYHCQPKNLGVLANFNYGIRQVATPYFSMLSDDDVLMPEFYAEAIAAFEAHPDIGAFSARTVLFEEQEQRLRRMSGSWKSGYYSPSLDTVLHMIRQHVATTGVVFNTAVRDTIGLLNEAASDIIYMVEVVNAHPFVFSDYEGAVFTIHGSSYTATESRTLGYRMDWALLFLNTVLNLTRRSADEKIRLMDAVYRITARLLTGECLNAVAQGRVQDFHSLLTQVQPMPLRVPVRMALWLAAFLSRSNTLATGLLPRVASMAFAQSARKARGSARSEADEQILRYMADLESSRSTPGNARLMGA